MARRSILGGANPAALVSLAALALLCVLALRDNYLVHRSQHALMVHEEDVPPWARSRRHRGTGSGGGGGGGGSGAARLAGEVWAGFAPPRLVEQRSELLNLLSADDKRDLESLCGRCLLHQLQLFAPQGNGHKVFVATGDITESWTRDSAVQLGAIIPRMQQWPALRVLLEGAVRTQAFFIVQDPWANAYNFKWRDPASYTSHERTLGRGGWVGTRNYELDSGAYFLQMLWNVYSTPGYARSQVLAEGVVFEAASLLVDVWTIEQHHEQRSPYRYSELPRNGLGPPTGFTGMTWSGFRPSDDQQQYGYNVPVNMYAYAALQRALELNRNIWHSDSFEKRARALAEGIHQGIEKWGIIKVDGIRTYALEVDGLGNNLTDYDDANVPSLLSIPVLGYPYDAEVYQATRVRILSSKNPLYFSGTHLKGIGSAHTRAGQVWPLALMVQGLTAPTAKERADMLRLLLKTQCNNGLMHESVNANDLSMCSREWFGWANSMLVALVESSLGFDCTRAAEEQHKLNIAAQEKSNPSELPRNGSPQDPAYFVGLLSTIAYDKQTLTAPTYIGQHAKAM